MNEILPFVCWKKNKFYLKVDNNYSSQICPNCRLFTGKKILNQRIHDCQYCHVKIERDLASSLVLKQRGQLAVGQTVGQEIACLERGAGVLQLTEGNPLGDSV